VPAEAIGRAAASVPHLPAKRYEVKTRALM
jgi:hypothetical protein